MDLRALCAGSILLAAFGLHASGQSRNLHRNHIATLRGSSKLDQFGWSIDSLGDLNRDGHPDFAVGIAGGDGPNGTDSGRVRIYSGRDHTLLKTLEGARPGDRFGIAVRGAGDIDRDGIPDLLVGVIGDDAGGSDAGRAIVYSGRDWKVLWQRAGTHARQNFGSSVDGAGDVDRDGTHDLLVGAINDSSGVASGGAAFVFSGKTGRLLHTFRGDKIGDQLGVSVAGVGDLDGDGHADVAAGAWKSDAAGKDAGMVRAFSGRTGKILHEWKGAKPLDFLGNSLAAAGDVDRDGTPDVVAGAYWAHRPLRHQGSASVFSGKTGKVIWSWLGDTWGDYLGTSVAGAGDVDRDGYADVIVGAWEERDKGPAAGSARIYSGKTGKLIRQFHGEGRQKFGVAVASAGDINQDDWPDVLVAAGNNHPQFEAPGEVQILSHRDLTLRSDTCCIAVRTGGAQRLQIDAGNQHAAQVYFFVGTASGTMPGIRVGSLTIPINRDAYHDVLLGAPNSLILGSFGILDSAGKASAQFRIIGGLSALSGLVLHHCYLVFDPSPVRLLDVSNAIPVKLK